MNCQTHHDGYKSKPNKQEKMEKIKDLRSILTNAICECCKNADCDTLEKIFECADWTWNDHVTDESYHPTAREIRTSMYELGKDALDSLMVDYESKDWGKEPPRPKTVMSGRLFFSIDWEIQGEEVEVLRDVVLACGISHELATTTIDDVTNDFYTVDTYADDDEYRKAFDRIHLS